MSDAVKKFGDVGVVTGHERLDLINQELRLLKLKNAENRTGTASERLAIKDARRELDFLEQAEKRVLQLPMKFKQLEKDLQSYKEH